MIATARTQADADTAIHSLLHTWRDALAGGPVEPLLACYADHAVHSPHDHPVPQEGTGALRSYYRRRLPPHRRDIDLEVHELTLRDPQRALATLTLRYADGPRLTMRLALAATGNRWRITHSVARAADATPA